MKSHVMLLGRVLEDSSIQCRTSTTKDLNTILSRVENEGLSFLTITLPDFGKDFERGLDQGMVTPDLFPGFRRKAGLPVFLGGLLGLVFDTTSGVLLDVPSIEAIQCVRQVCYLFKRLELPCSSKRVTAAFDDYVECDKEVGIKAIALGRTRYARADFHRMSNILFSELLSEVNYLVYEGLLVPKHGPGSTADRLLGNAKYDCRSWTTRLEDAGFYSGEYLYTSWSHFAEDEKGPIYLEPEDEPPVRVVAVPKTLKAPRIIAIEPTYMQYVQQAIKEALVENIEQDDILNKFLGFTDQEVNRTMACYGSANSRSLATLDLSEASDRVSTWHVDCLIGNRTHLGIAVDACRSAKAEVPGHGIIALNKYASMGSALTFPLEAMVFLTVVFLGIESSLKTPMTRELFKSFIGKVRVYGDDIIVPVEHVQSVISTLEAFGLKVNARKSFWTGKFRESCGGDYYDGIDVSVVKARTDIPTSRKHVREIVSTVSLRNQMYFAGFWRTADYLDGKLEAVIPFPTTWPESPGLGRHTYLDYEIQRTCPNLQRPLVKAAVVKTVLPYSRVSGHGALLKYFLKRGDEPFADKNHLERAGRPEVLSIKLRYVTPY